ncbi:Hypothetical predicted protein [Pelobates cultripes]|uniref:Uncharacterized protein n=1 Tax=Pelobates cultripes TaxID=61616 RepID=A0AAD1WS35_PELCU|nr:Hypothetical predicted protein [Pelobates cultripes]
MINQATIHKRKQVAHLEKTLMTLRTLEAQHKLNPTPETNGKIAECQTKIKKYMAKDSTKALLWSKQLFYDKANKADTLLARKLKQRTERKQITKINTPEGTLTEKPSEIAGVFQKYFEALYDHSPTTRQNPTHTNTLIDQYLQQVPLPSLPTEAEEALASPITPEELAGAIKTLKPNKSPGPDGFTGLYYKTYASTLIPHLCNLYNAILAGDQLPPDMLQANTLKPPTPPRTIRHIPSSTSHPHTQKHKRAKTTKHNPQPHKLREPPDKKFQRAEQIPQNRTPRNKYNRTKHIRQLRRQLKQPKSSDHTTKQPYQQPQRLTNGLKTHAGRHTQRLTRPPLITGSTPNLKNTTETTGEGNPPHTSPFSGTPLTAPDITVNQTTRPKPSIDNT